jgi:5-methylcytosine-specific restriction endonuclease McrA
MLTVSLESKRACSKCGSPDNDFPKCSRTKDSLASVCKPCKNEEARRKYTDPAVKAALLRKNAEWQKANPDKANAKSKSYQARHPEKVAAARKAYVRANRDRVYAKNSARSQAGRTATVKWANRFFMAEAYLLAKLRTKLTGVAHEVDHIIPLKHPMVCGLHVETNLRVIPAVENRAKSNAFLNL